MKIWIEAVDASVHVVKDDQGKPIGIELTPQLTKKTGPAVVARGGVVNDHGKAFDKFDLTVSAATGRLAKVSRTATVRAAIDEHEESDGE